MEVVLYLQYAQIITFTENEVTQRKKVLFLYLLRNSYCLGIFLSISGTPPSHRCGLKLASIHGLQPKNRDPYRGGMDVANQDKGNTRKRILK